MLNIVASYKLKFLERPIIMTMDLNESMHCYLVAHYTTHFTVIITLTHNKMKNSMFY